MESKPSVSGGSHKCIKDYDYSPLHYRLMHAMVRLPWKQNDLLRQACAASVPHHNKYFCCYSDSRPPRLQICTTDTFSLPSISGQQIPRARRTTEQFQLKAHAASSELLSLLSRNIDVSNADQDRDALKSTVSALETSFLNSNISNIESRSRFDPLVGLYEVKSVITANQNDNPVGGKWTCSNGLAQKLFRTRAAYQHLLPFNSTGQSSFLRPEEAVAEAINVVSLDSLDGLLRVTVVLRGDAVPLSIEERFRMKANRTITPLTNLAVQAVFDQPRIFLVADREKTNIRSFR
jgi:hypothetical protein